MQPRRVGKTEWYAGDAQAQPPAQRAGQLIHPAREPRRQEPTGRRRRGHCGELGANGRVTRDPPEKATVMITRRRGQRKRFTRPARAYAMVLWQRRCHRVGTIIPVRGSHARRHGVVTTVLTTAMITSIGKHVLRDHAQIIAHVDDDDASIRARVFIKIPSTLASWRLRPASRAAP